MTTSPQSAGELLTKEQIEYWRGQLTYAWNDSGPAGKAARKQINDLCSMALAHLSQASEPKCHICGTTTEIHSIDCSAIGKPQASERADGVMVPPVDPERANRVTKWIPTTDLKLLRRLGKTTEECGELLAVLARCVIQGIDEIDPSSGKCNRQRLVEELADVQAQINCTVESIGLDRVYIATRVTRKEGYMREWEGMFGDSAAPVASVSADARDAEAEARLLRLGMRVALHCSDLLKVASWPDEQLRRYAGLIPHDAALEKK